jgi:hypothetical protein
MFVKPAMPASRSSINLLASFGVTARPATAIQTDNAGDVCEDF